MKYLPTLAWLVVAAPGAAQAPMYDLLITGGRVLDGTGVPAFDADVAIRGDRIVNVSRARLPGSTARRVIDATGLVVAPGFIDMHAHLEPLGDWPDAESAVRQGVTTVVGNPDGGGPYPIARYLQSLEARPLGLNAAFFVGHNTIPPEGHGARR